MKTGARRGDEPRLYGAKEAAAALGVQQPNLRVVAGLPEPYVVLSSTTLWRAEEIDKLAKKRASARKAHPFVQPAAVKAA